MPYLNGKGPLGQGPMTGKKLGKCKKSISNKTEDNANENKENNNTAYGLRKNGFNRGTGFGNRFGQGGGRRRGFGKGKK